LNGDGIYPDAPRQQLPNMSWCHYSYNVFGELAYGVGSAFPSASKIRGMAPWEKGRLWFGKIVAHGTVGGASSAVSTDKII